VQKTVVEKGANGVTSGCAVMIIHLASLYRSTLSGILVYRKRVLQGHHVNEANDFARYVLNCGMTEIMEKAPKECERLQKLFPYDGKHLWQEANLLRLECGEYFSGRTRDAEGTAKGGHKSDLENIDKKLASVLRAVSRSKKRRSSAVPQKPANVIPLFPKALSVGGP
jgi:hypothetical protein